MWPLAFCLCLGPVLASTPPAPAEDLDLWLDRMHLQGLEDLRQNLKLSKELVFLGPLEGPADVLRRARRLLGIWKDERAVAAMRKATEDRIRWRQTLHGPPRPPDPEVEKFMDEVLQKLLKNWEKERSAPPPPPNR